MLKIDINCDLGEGSNQTDCERDARLMPYISSCNIACGGHAGNELTVKLSLKNAKLNHLKIGAHLGYPDQANFGRISLSISLSELLKSIQQQLDLFLSLATEQDISVHHIKFHGALYNDVENNPKLASELAEFLYLNYKQLKVIGLADGVFGSECTKIGLSFIAEGFMDRSYLAKGTLTPRSLAGAVIRDKDKCIQQAILLASQKPIQTSDQASITPLVETICLHGDNENALSIASDLAEALKKEGFDIK